MSRRGAARVAFGAGFALLLADGAAAIFLGQLAGRAGLVVVGLLLLVAALALVAAWRRWMIALAALEDARRDLRAEIARLRGAVQDLRAGRNPF